VRLAAGHEEVVTRAVGCPQRLFGKGARHRNFRGIENAGVAYQNFDLPGVLRLQRCAKWRPAKNRILIVPRAGFDR